MATMRSEVSLALALHGLTPPPREPPSRAQVERAVALGTHRRVGEPDRVAPPQMVEPVGGHRHVRSAPVLAHERHLRRRGQPDPDRGDRPQGLSAPASA